ncbi:glycosyltransferase [Micromonospora sp. NPDC049679]|uniref:glycosyltransferase n=1 Tax=Micromonospora sp. NPDC049679 TaxID=3155920 RepID=UPI0033EF955F
MTELPRDGERKSEPAAGDRVIRTLVTAESVSWLGHLLQDPASLVKVRRITIVVDSWHIPQRGWSGRLGPLPHLLRQRIRMPKKDHGRAVIDLELRWSIPLRTVVAAVLPVLTPVRPMPHPASPDITAQDVLPSWLGVGQNISAVAGDLPRNDDIRPHDVVLTATGAPAPSAEPEPPVEGKPPVPAGDNYASVLAGESSGVAVGTRPSTVVIDVERALLAGRYGPFGTAAPRAELTFTGSAEGRAWRITGPDGVICTGRLDHPLLSEDAVEALTELGLLTCSALPGAHPLAEAALLVRLSMVGVLVHVPQLPAACAAHLADELRDLITAPLPGSQESEFEWEVRVVRQRRAALRHHATGFALPPLGAGAFPALTEPPSVSALLVTKRLDYVVDAMAAIEKQTYPNLEIVLCLHGVELPRELRDVVARCSRHVELLNLPADRGFGEAIGEATARARGSLVTKFDDDDTYGPEHVWDLVLARHHSGAAMVGKSAEFVYLQTLDTTVRRAAGRPEAYVQVVAGGTMLISRGDLEQVGGWRPVPRSIDRGLIDRVRRAGGLIYRTHPLGYVYHRRSDGHTWDPGLEYFLRDSGMQWTGLPRHAEFGTATGGDSGGGAPGPVELTRSRSGPAAAPASVSGAAAPRQADGPPSRVAAP